MTVTDYAAKYQGTLGDILRSVAALPGSGSVGHAWVRDARRYLEMVGVDRQDADAIAELLSREQMRRLGQLLDGYADQLANDGDGLDAAAAWADLTAGAVPAPSIPEPSSGKPSIVGRLLGGVQRLVGGS